MLDRKTIKRHARAVLSENYWTLVGAVLVYTLIAVLIAMFGVIGGLVTIILIPVIVVGLLNMFVRAYRGEKVEFSDMFQGFNNFGHNLGGYWYMYLFVFLWALLFYIPGIVKAFAYSMAPFILMDQPEVDPTDALKRSMEMTDGHKGQLFVMYLSFIGWALLSVFTLGLLSLFFVMPYMMLTYAGYYVVLRNQELQAQRNSGSFSASGDFMTNSADSQMGFSQVTDAQTDNPYMNENFGDPMENNPYM